MHFTLCNRLYLNFFQRATRVISNGTWYLLLPVPKSLRFCCCYCWDAHQMIIKIADFLTLLKLIWPLGIYLLRSNNSFKYEEGIAWLQKINWIYLSSPFSKLFRRKAEENICKDIKNLRHAWNTAIQFYKQLNKWQMQCEVPIHEF